MFRPDDPERSSPVASGSQQRLTGVSGRILLGRAGPVELATEVKVEAPLEEG